MIRDLFCVAVLLIFDLAWISLNRPIYNQLVQRIQGSKLVVSLGPAVVAYALMVLGLLYIVLPNARRELSAGATSPFVLALKHGALFGFVVYGIFNATNAAMFANYSVPTAILDTTWGTFVYFAITWMALLLS